MRRACIAPLAIAVLAACPGARHARDPAADPSTLEIGRDATSLRGVAADRDVTFVAVASGTASTIEARRGATLLWSAKLGGTAGPIARQAPLVFATLAGTGTLADQHVRGEPAAMVVALEQATGAPRWKTAIESSEWAQVTTISGTARGAIIGGAFSGTLRIGSSVVSSAGKSDGFVARLGQNGQPEWLIRVGGPHADSVQGVSERNGRYAIAGTFAAGAELGGVPLLAFDERAPYADGFVATLDERTGARLWAATFGGKLDDSVAGVVIDEAENVVVAANARDTMHVGGLDLVAHGDADGLVAWWTKAGALSHAILIGGPDFDGLRAISTTGDRVLVAGFFSGALELGNRTMKAGGGDDAFIAALDTHGAVVESWQVGGSGREEITTLVGIPGGFLAGIAHTAAASIGGSDLPAPKDPMSGAAIVVRPVR
jgi:hypothetical protein